MARPWIEKNKKSGFYYVRWREDGKKVYEKCGQSYQNAVAVKEIIEKRLLYKEQGIIDRDRTFDSLQAEYMKSCQTNDPRTIEHKKYTLAKALTFFSGRKLISITPADIEKFKQHLLKTHEVNGVNILLNPLSACLGYAVKMGYLEKNPAKGSQLKSIEVAKILTSKEVQSLYAACDSNPALKSIVRIALHTGLRQGNILKLRPDNIRDGYLYIEDKKKGDNPSVIPIHPEIHDDLKVDLTSWNKRRLCQAFERARERAHIKCRFHDLRHTFCSFYLKDGTILDLLKITGHRNIKSLQRYAHFEKNYLKERIRNLSFQ